jgi:hypothetical protein
MGACRDESIVGEGDTAHSDSEGATQVPGGQDSGACVALGNINRRASERDGCGCALRVFILASVYERADLAIKLIIVARSPMLADLLDARRFDLFSLSRYVDTSPHTS